MKLENTSIPLVDSFGLNSSCDRQLEDWPVEAVYSKNCKFGVISALGGL
jgi:hypothetical protein